MSERILYVYNQNYERLLKEKKYNQNTISI